VSDKRTLLGALCLLAMLVPMQGVSAQQNTATAAAGAEIVGPSLNLTSVNPLAFGRIKSTAPGTVTITVAPQRTSTGGVVLIGSGQCSTPPCDTSNQSNESSASFWSPAVYTIAGNPNAAYRVTASSTASATLKSGSSAPATLEVTGINVATSSSGWVSNVGTLDSSGQDSIRVGGTLQVTVILNASSYYLYDLNVPITVQYN
jgi:hypothetical protein